VINIYTAFIGKHFLWLLCKIL